MSKRIVKTVFAVIIASSGCSTSHVVDEAPTVPIEVTLAPHPASFDTIDLHTLLTTSPLAPAGVLGQFAETCDDDFRKLISMTTISTERLRGAEELVTTNTNATHWCFYAKISKLQRALQSESTTWTEKQKKIISTYEYLSPIANAFMRVNHDTHYYKWAAQYYSKASEWVFFQHLETSPEGSAVMMQAEHDANKGFNTDPAKASENAANASQGSVFSKYGIAVNTQAIAAQGVQSVTPEFDDSARSPASSVHSVMVPTESGRSIGGQTNSGPVNTGPVDSGPVNSAPVNSVPAQSTHTFSVPVDRAHSDSAPVDSVPSDDSSSLKPARPAIQTAPPIAVPEKSVLDTEYVSSETTSAVTIPGARSPASVSKSTPSTIAMPKPSAPSTAPVRVPASPATTAPAPTAESNPFQ